MYYLMDSYTYVYLMALQLATWECGCGCHCDKLWLELLSDYAHGHRYDHCWDYGNGSSYGYDISVLNVTLIMCWSSELK